MKKTITILALMLMAIHILNAQWVDLGTNTHPLNANNIIYSVVTDASGNVYAAGKFSYGGKMDRRFGLGATRYCRV
jgi:hypothetical protein